MRVKLIEFFNSNEIEIYYEIITEFKINDIYEFL